MKHHSSRNRVRSLPPAYRASSNVPQQHHAGSAFIAARSHPPRVQKSSRFVVSPPPTFLESISLALRPREETSLKVAATNSDIPAAEPGVGAVGIRKSKWIIDWTPLDICVVQHTGGIAPRPVIWMAIDRFTCRLIAAHVDVKGGQS